MIFGGANVHKRCMRDEGAKGFTRGAKWPMNFLRCMRDQGAKGFTVNGKVGHDFFFEQRCTRDAWEARAQRGLREGQSDPWIFEMHERPRRKGVYRKWQSRPWFFFLAKVHKWCMRGEGAKGFTRREKQRMNFWDAWEIREQRRLP